VSLVNRYLFRPEQRIRNSAGFQVVFDSPSCKVAQPQYLVLVRGNTQAKSRLGFVIARKKIRLAVERNRIKRMVAIVLDCISTTYPLLISCLLHGKV
jgi:ribonuclease P protein component